MNSFNFTKPKFTPLHICQLIGLALALNVPTMAQSFQGSRASGPATPLQVGATVLPRTSLVVVNAPTLFQVTEADIQRGYADVDEPLNVSLSTNERNGTEVLLWLVEDAAIRGELTGLGATVEVAAGRNLFRFPVQQRNSAVAYRLNFRLHLQPGLKPGSYPWPIALYAPKSGTFTP